MKYPVYQVDAFTIKPFTGNPAAVVLLDQPKEDAWMQAVAAEMNLSETAFLLAKGDDYSLRWFTPITEVDLCGHATLASAHILFEFGFYEPDETISFNTKSGVITATFKQGTIELIMPRREPVAMTKTPEIEAVFCNDIVDLAQWSDRLLLLEFKDTQSVLSFVPHFKQIASLPWDDFIITSKSEGKFDFISRFFSPHTGINEDPVTGMSFCVLGPYWQAKLGKSDFHAFQASARGGEVWVKVADSQILVGGKAVTVCQGELLHQH
jgi:PhzF family phenazine biosynthesis protein